jgi:hypothetical protein
MRSSVDRCLVTSQCGTACDRLVRSPFAGATLDEPLDNLSYRSRLLSRGEQHGVTLHGALRVITSEPTSPKGSSFPFASHQREHGHA